LSNVCNQASTRPSNPRNAGIPQLPGPNNPSCAPCRRRSGRCAWERPRPWYQTSCGAARRGAIHAIHTLYRDERPALACLRTGHSVRNPRASLRAKGRKRRGATSDARAVADQGADSGVVEEGVAGLGGLRRRSRRWRQSPS